MPQYADPVPPIHDEGTFDISLLAIANVALRYWRLLVILPFVAAVCGAIATLIFQSFTAQSRFAPNQAGELTGSRLAGIAAQFGFTMPSSDPAGSIDFFGALLSSRELLTSVVQARYAFVVDSTKHDSLSGTYSKLYGIDEDTPQQTLTAAVTHLTDRVTVTKDAASGVVTLEVKAHWPQLAEQLNRRLLDLVSEFNLEKRQSAAAAERRFVEGRLNDTKAQLEQEEAKLMHFLQENRSYAESPRLKFEADQLQSRVDLSREVYTTLAQSYEQARIDEVRDTPVITIIDRPEGSFRPNSSFMVNGLLGVVVGGLLALGLVLGKEYFRRERQKNPEELAEFESLRLKMLTELLRFPRWVVRRVKRA